MLLKSILTLAAFAATAVVAPPPNATVCEQLNWDLGDAPDPNAPPGPYPVSGQQVYIQDPLNFCLILPSKTDPTLKSIFYDQGKFPTIVAGEGYVQSYCMGDYLTPGAVKIAPGGIRAAHVRKDFTRSGKRYWEITGRLDCDALQIDCVGSGVGVYDDGGQYDNVPYRNCGKEPYSGVDASKHPGLTYYNEQAGNGIFCMRVCEGGNQLGDPCNVKNDTAGCVATMGMVDREGFSFLDMETGESRTFSVSLPPLKTTTTTPTTGAAGAAVTTTAGPAGASTTAAAGANGKSGAPEAAAAAVGSTAVLAVLGSMLGLVL
ncbi:hypothetical protein HDV05_004681 [Chytridiales sp. JEL 0842]|nr:hypothetical protein HDV05_004681 [Chytridiales sp. JEL 0842]